ncbi:ABC transporter related protein [Xenorhabdus poinarii G6]|uniref:ABC transporter related protein n=1 Tax=Xenorhabdus poinarii G6 TaxID=1354304 RepID=A0A068R1I7_9GAMM|nr:ABC transporter ATP-binding protein [Xenorhabdus poinarii]CDG20726.1 ABC transporter related protein [Xenorhabdus poinarii G6]
MLTAKNITATYGHKTVLHDLSVGFAQGRITALVGSNGCGKSTLLKSIMGFIPLKSGEILLEGKPIAGIGRKALARKIAYLPQECHCPDYMTLGELIELAATGRHSLFGGASARDRKLFREVLDIVGLADKASSQVSALSGGQRQRAWVAMVLAQDTDIILMDEPVNHLDIKYQYTVLKLIRDLSLQHGKTIVVVLHDLNLTTTFADDVVMLNTGNVVAAGAVSQTITVDNIQRVFDIPADIFSYNGSLICQPYPGINHPENRSGVSR